MKKIISGILALTMLCSAALSLTACGSSTAKIQSIDDLKNVKIGVQLGTTGDIYATDCEKDGCSIDRYNKGADAVLALTQDKVDCVIIDNEPAKALVAENEGLKILETAYADEDYAICVKKGNSELLEKLNGAIDELTADGTIDKIVSKYIG